MPDDSCKLLVTTTAVDEAAVAAGACPAELLESDPAHVTPTRSVDQYNISSFEIVTIKDDRDLSLQTKPNPLPFPFFKDSRNHL